MKEIEKLKYWLLQVSKLASERSEFYNPFDLSEAKKIRNYVLSNREIFAPSCDGKSCDNCSHLFSNPFDQFFCDKGKSGKKVCKHFKKR